MKILITGANGFLGSHLVEKSLSKGHDTIALVRKDSDQSNLNHLQGFQAIPVDYSSVDSIKSTLNNLPGFDLVIHNAGMVKSYTFSGYKKVNIELTEKLLKALEECIHFNDQLKFAYISSLAAIGPVGHNGPASNYGRSKQIAEGIVRKSRLKYLIFRPTGIYGSRDVQFVPLIKAAKLGIYPSMTPKHHKMTLINASDVAENVIDCSIRHGNEIIHLEDGNVYEHHHLKATLEKILSKKTLDVRVSGPIVKSILFLSDFVDKILGKTPKLSREHYSEISQNWDYDFSEERNRIPLKIHYSLEKGFREALEYYQANNLI
ncbi:MAG: NAD-dependent epimerase/dehydratase family protein [Marinoscillum sp.]|uniref:NAD-dependent epimerase/dehydratase family protein n=1 Tax=Marinoscillum sp. TaxID=2024838 RepID=UPI0032F6F337